jgi:hypothetical protein
MIPRAVRFERLSELTDSQAHLARQWTRLSPCRLILDAVSIIALVSSRRSCILSRQLDASSLATVRMAPLAPSNSLLPREGTDIE